MKQGWTLLEVVIGSAILGSVLAIAYAVLASATRLGESEVALRDRHFQLHVIEDHVAAEMRESSPALIRTSTFTDPSMPTANQTVLTIVSARDASETFQVLNATPQWQKVVVYAPYWNATLATGELHRYEISPAPVAFTDAAQTPSVSVTSATLTVAGIAIDRGGGRRMLLGVDFFQAAISANQVTLNVALQGSSLVESSSVNLQAGATGRN